MREKRKEEKKKKQQTKTEEKEEEFSSREEQLLIKIQEEKTRQMELDRIKVLKEEQRTREQTEKIRRMIELNAKNNIDDQVKQRSIRVEPKPGWCDPHLKPIPKKLMDEEEKSPMPELKPVVREPKPVEEKQKSYQVELKQSSVEKKEVVKEEVKFELPKKVHPEKTEGEAQSRWG